VEEGGSKVGLLTGLSVCCVLCVWVCRVALENLRNNVARRIDTWSVLKRAHSGSTYWMEVSTAFHNWRL